MIYAHPQILALLKTEPLLKMLDKSWEREFNVSQKVLFVRTIDSSHDWQSN